jgi:hypothetical protein
MAALRSTTTITNKSTASRRPTERAWIVAQEAMKKETAAATLASHIGTRWSAGGARTSTADQIPRI